VGVLSPSVLLNAWDEGAGQSAPARAVILLTAARPERTAAEWTAVSVGERDHALLCLREELFGPRIEAAIECPECGERLELAFTPGDITTPVALSSEETLHLSVEGYDLTYRLPATADLLAIAGCGRADLLDRCVQARRGGEIVKAGELPEPVSRAVSQAMADADPRADVRLALDCPACSHRWQAMFDIVSFLWGEVEDWALQTLREVHALASAYGWSEREILSLSLRRRRMYLDMVGV
jgi:hypothetical protein